MSIPSHQESSKKTTDGKGSGDIQSHSSTILVIVLLLCLHWLFLFVCRCRLGALAGGCGLAVILIIVAAVVIVIAALVRGIGEYGVAAVALDDLASIFALLLRGATFEALKKTAAEEGIAGAVGEGLACLVAITEGGDGVVVDTVLNAQGPSRSRLGRGGHGSHKGERGYKSRDSEMHVWRLNRKVRPKD